MSGTSLEIAKKIGVASDLGGVVRSMKALAASSLGQYQRAADSLEGYVFAVRLGLGACLRQDSIGHQGLHHKLHFNSAASVIVIVFGSDQGLVGSFNESAANLVDASLAERGDAHVVVWAVGERMVTLLQSRALEVKPIVAAASIDAVSRVVAELLAAIAAARESSSDVSVEIVHHHLEPGAIDQPIVTRLLPFDESWRNNACAVEWPGKQQPEMIGGQDAVLAALVDAYLFVMLFRACVESLASENSSRLAAMQRAEKNIDGLLDDLSRRYHRIRQEAIDEELFDVIAGFDPAQDPDLTGTPRIPEAHSVIQQKASRPIRSATACLLQIIQ
jgi:F-type H+-transporting ATPase subunit gamma